MEAFADRAGRIVLLSSGDVYRAYGRFTAIEPGPIEEGLLTEDSPLRSVLFPYRKKASSPEVLEYWYEKILAERPVLGCRKCTDKDAMRTSQPCTDTAITQNGVGLTVTLKMLRPPWFLQRHTLLRLVAYTTSASRTLLRSRNAWSVCHHQRWRQPWMSVLISGKTLRMTPAGYESSWATTILFRSKRAP
jgi:hypothetical protein